MIRSLGIVIGVGALIATSTSVGLASNVPQEDNQGVQIRANGALSNIENRSVSKDFDDFFVESPTTTNNYPGGTIGQRSRNDNEIPILDDVRIEIGDDSPNANVDIFPNASNGDRSDNSQILYEFEEW